MVSIPVVAPARDGDEQRRLPPGLPADIAGEVVTIHSGQADVEQQDLGPELARNAESLDSVEGGANVVPDRFEQHSQADRGVAIVVDDQNALDTRSPAQALRRTERRCMSLVSH